MVPNPTADIGVLTPGAQRILEVASELFYEHGIHAVGVDTIAAESGVTKRTLYGRFGSKDGLVTAYLQVRDRRWRSMVTAHLEKAGSDPLARVLVPFDALPDWLIECTRGCSFINAFAELPDVDHPGRQVIVAEKTWLLEYFQRTLAEAGVERPDQLAVQLLSLHEGPIVAFSIAGAAASADAARTAARTLVETELDAHAIRGAS